MHICKYIDISNVNPNVKNRLSIKIKFIFKILTIFNIYFIADIKKRFIFVYAIMHKNKNLLQ